jgi:FtsH-binding integral membrane protein
MKPPVRDLSKLTDLRVYRTKDPLKQSQKPDKILLYAGLLILCVSFIFKRENNPVLFGILLSTAILLKVFFLITVFQAKGFKQEGWLYLMLTGVAVMLFSLFFKNSLPVLHKLLFYLAISLKLSGLLLLIFQNKK